MYIVINKIRIITILALLSIANGSITAQIVNIPDPNFKTALVNNISINTNGDSEIQVSEAEAFSGIIDVNSLSIYDLTGIEAFTEITELNCNFNMLININITQNSKLIHLYCHYNEFTSLDISGNTDLLELGCSGNHLSNLDFSSNNSLVTLACHENEISDIDISNLSSLEFLNCSTNQLTNLDVSQNSALITLFCEHNQLSVLDVSMNPHLILLDCNFNQLTNIDLTNNTSITSLEICSNQLSTLDITGLTGLTELICCGNQFTSLDISQNSLLTWLDVSGNQLIDIDITDLSSLEIFHCSQNLFTSIDISNNHSVINFNGSANNNLNYLNVQNDNNINFELFEAKFNPNLYCIQVDNSTWSEEHWNDIDPQAEFSENCPTGIDDSYSETGIAMYPNPCTDYLTITNYDNNYRIEILNIIGQLIFSRNNSSTSSSYEIDLSGFSNGVYFVKLFDQQKTTIKKIIVN
jgi:Leucine-rich repeat (LRR) protein